MYAWGLLTTPPREGTDVEQRVGTCSLCGGSVIGYRGIWMAVTPPPPDRCSGCGAVTAYDVIPMVRIPHPRPDTSGYTEFDLFRTITTSGTSGSLTVRRFTP